MSNLVWKTYTDLAMSQIYSLTNDGIVVAQIFAKDDGSFHWFLLDAPRWEHNGIAPTKEEAQSVVEGLLSKIPNLIQEVDDLRNLLEETRCMAIACLDVGEKMEDDGNFVDMLPGHYQGGLERIVKKLNRRE